MSSGQPPDWWARQRGPRFGCADVTIVSIASITAFVILLFILLRPDAQNVLDNPGAGNATVSAIRPTETPTKPPLTPTATNAPTVANPPTATIAPTPSFRRANVKQECRLRQEPSFEATVIQVFKPGTVFKIYSDQKPDPTRGETWSRVEPEDGTNRLGWMVLSCFN